ncbi:CotH kinase family protein [Corallococcus exiguus]|uniref:CotH kinase family protein n=1 Tax=Corallococcus exiguus TaxID=83462 RepID=UPI001560E7EF|nr:CotH kinase family protein [Corallococcus exiguus]
MRTRRWWTRGLAGLACFALVACGGGDTPSPTNDTPSGTDSDAGTHPQSDAGTVDGGTQPSSDAGTGSQSDAGTGTPDAGTAPKACAPTAGNTRWVLEGETFTAQVTCATGLKEAGLRFGVKNLPAGATFDESTATLRWTPALNQGAVWMLTLEERTTDETGTLKVGVANNDNAPGKVDIVDPVAYTEEYGLPVVHLFFDPAVGLTSGGYRPAEVVYRGHRFTMEAKYRGATSSVFPKRSLTFKFAEDDLFSEPVFGDGFKDRKRLVLITPFNDNSYLRSRLAFDLWNRLSPDAVRIRTFSVVVYANNKYRGLYTAADHVDKRLMEWNGIDNDSDLFKAVDADANFSRLKRNGQTKEHLHVGFEKDEGTPEQNQPHAFDTLDAFVAWVADSSADGFRQEFGTKLKARDYEDWWIFNTLIQGNDSQGKNAYHAYDPKAGGPWRFIPWDLDASFGQNYDTTRTSATARPTYAYDNLLFKRMLAESTIAGPMRERYRQALKNELSEAAVQALIDGYVQELGPNAQRDEARWATEYRNFAKPEAGSDGGYGNFPDWHLRQDFKTHAEEVEYIRQWVHTRWGAFQSQLP